MKDQPALPTWLQRVWVVPFEAAFALLVMILGLLGLLNVLPLQGLDLALPDWAYLVSQAAFLLSGLAIVMGLAFGRGDIEGPGVVLVGVSLLMRAVAEVWLLGPGHLLVWVDASFDLIFCLACMGRVLTLLRGNVLVKVKGPE